MEEVKSLSTKKSYLEAALTPSTTPTSSPSNLYVINNQMKTGIIDIKLKWYTNNNNDDEICYICKKGILEDEWNSYYTVYIKRYKNIMDEYKIDISNDRNTCDKKIYCYHCMTERNKKFLEEKNKLLKETTEMPFLSLI
jgi:hypothetical protein